MPSLFCAPLIGGDEGCAYRTGCFFIGKDDLLGFAVLLTRRRSVNKGCHQQQEQRCTEKGNPEVGIVHVGFSYQYQPNFANVRFVGQCSFFGDRDINVVFNATRSVDGRVFGATVDLNTRPRMATKKIGLLGDA